jgi:hypothetical protein
MAGAEIEQKENVFQRPQNAIDFPNKSCLEDNMKKSFFIQDDLHTTYHSLLNQLPEPLRDDAQIQKVVLVYLKLGGEKLAQHGIDVIKKRFKIEHFFASEEPQETDASFGEEVDMTEPHPHELGGFEFPVE